MVRVPPIDSSAISVFTPDAGFGASTINSTLSQGVKLKKYLVLFFCSFLPVGPVSAQMSDADTQKFAATVKRAWQLRGEAESRAMEACNTTRAVYSYPSNKLSYGTKDTKISLIEETREGVISLKWTGGCEGGKRDGPGVLSWTVETDDSLGNQAVWAWTSEGRFVNGQRLGMWCMTQTFQFTSGGRVLRKTADSGCSVLAGHTNPLTGNFRKQPDGSWKGYENGEPIDSSMAARALEAQSAKVLADAAAGKADLKVALVVQSRSLDDLVRGSRIVMALSTAPVPLKDKRVAIVLSSQMVSELERFKRERQALIDASAGLRGEAAAERAEFIRDSDPDRLLVNILKVVKKHAKAAQPADDLAGLKEGGFDYALVVDWKSATRFDQLGKYGSFPRASLEAWKAGYYAAAWKAGTVTAIAGETLGGFLIGRDLKAIKQFSGGVNVAIRPPSQWDGFTSDDLAYMGTLASYFAAGWGNGKDDLGSLVIDLDAGLE